MYELDMTEEEYKNFIKKVKVKMLELGITERDLARKVGYSTSTIYGFFAGRYSRFLAAAISKELGVKK